MIIDIFNVINGVLFQYIMYTGIAIGIALFIVWLYCVIKDIREGII
jgi:hypothetical protein